MKSTANRRRLHGGDNLGLVGEDDVVIGGFLFLRGERERDEAEDVEEDEQEREDEAAEEVEEL